MDEKFAFSSIPFYVSRYSKNRSIISLYQFSLNHISTHIRLQSLWYLDTIRSLKIFKQSCNDARQSKSRTVQRVAELDRFVTLAVTTLQTVCLISIEI